MIRKVRKGVGGLFSAVTSTAMRGSSSRSEVVNRLAEQCAPLMTRLLRQYGEAHPSLRAMAQDPKAALASLSIRELKAQLKALGGDPAGCLEKADIIEQLAAGENHSRLLPKMPIR